MTRINTNVASLRGVRNLARSNSLLDKSLTRLSTGLKINSGKDNPAGLIASETLRSQITVIEQSITNSNRANNVISTADAALGEINGLLNQVRGLIQEGLNDGALSQPEKEANQTQIDAALSAINRISANTTFAGDKLIDGSKSYRTTQTTADAGKLDDFQVRSAVFAGSSNIVIDAQVTTAASKGELFSTAVSGGGGLAASTTLEISGSTGTDVVFLGAGSSLSDAATAINALTDSTGVTVTKTDAVAGTGALDSVATDADLVITDARGLDTSNGQTVKLVIASTAAGNQALDITSSSTSTEITITVTLETNASSVSQTTGTDLIAALASDADSSGLVSAALAAGNDGSGVISFNINAGSLDVATDASLTFSSNDFGSAEFVGVKALQGTFTTTTVSTSGSASERAEGTDIVATINGQLAQGKGLKASITTAQLDASVSFNTTNNVAAANSKVTVTGGGALFQIGQEVSAAGQIGIGIDGVNTARLGGISGKLFELGSGGGKSLLDVSPSNPGSGLVKIIDEAISKVSNLRGRLGAIQKNVIETNISTLGVALESISAARSQIIDTDFASETAALTRAQILNQSGLSVLGIANQNPSQVLSLLG